ncbi:MAG: hypothetical protein U9N09_07025 [Euryarchaeota archaeon]|nr:hypothetical protein [Euryarchaeota archaeon]
MTEKTHFATIVVLAAMLLALATVSASADEVAVNDTNQTYNMSVTINSTAVNDTETSYLPHNDFIIRCGFDQRYRQLQ